MNLWESAWVIARRDFVAVSETRFRATSPAAALAAARAAWLRPWRTVAPARAPREAASWRVRQVP